MSGSRPVTHRAFVSLNPDAQAVAGLMSLQSKLRLELERGKLVPDGVRWTRPDQFHLTLVFLGGVPDLLVPWVSDCLRGIHREYGLPRLVCASLGCFPVFKPPRALWVGFEKDAALDALRSALVDRLSDKIDMERAGEFFPHLTLARVRQRKAGRQGSGLADALEAFAGRGLPRIAWTPQSVSLMASVTHAEGPRYSVLAGSGGSGFRAG